MTRMVLSDDCKHKGARLREQAAPNIRQYVGYGCDVKVPARHRKAVERANNLPLYMHCEQCWRDLIRVRYQNQLSTRLAKAVRINSRFLTEVALIAIPPGAGSAILALAVASAIGAGGAGPFLSALVSALVVSGTTLGLVVLSRRPGTFQWPKRQSFQIERVPLCTSSHCTCDRPSPLVQAATTGAQATLLATRQGATRLSRVLASTRARLRTRRDAQRALKRSAREWRKMSRVPRRYAGAMAEPPALPPAQSVAAKPWPTSPTHQR